ncbi:fatty acid synthase-like [Bicyclus anynana]|uniref:Fatty acid synthase-like n=1 Tax=Bicyclus anynana TaxID=110368 RepID=A0ABM3LJI9_BICAN|nr:fatty acid synthase-like [Bicyclus anynana]
MAPTPKNLSLIDEGRAADYGSDQRIVISGMSGAYPESNSVKELSDILYNKINPVNNENCRWKYDHPEVSQYTGKVPGLNLFDAQFFRVHYYLSHNMEPMARKLLEKAFEAIFDAGVCPEELSGKKVGVFIGNGNAESEKAIFDVNLSKSGVGLVGCCRAMYANRISYWLNVKGPSLTVDEFCCSSTKALEQGYLAIQRGECDAAIVGGSALCLHPQAILHYGRITKISLDGKTKSFDSEAAGCAKSDAINVLFLQKAENALRAYADVVHVKTEFISIPSTKTGPSYGFYRDPEIMANFMRNFYKDTKVSPQDVEYVEAFGSAEPDADKAELEAIEKVYCKNRRDPLLVGSVTSNIGYAEGASGISAVTKVLLGFHYGQLAGNLHCDSPRTDIDALRDGRIRILTDHQSFGRRYAAVNTISVTGVNSHVLLYGHYKPKDINRYKVNFPQLVTLSGRQETAVDKIIQDLKSRPVDPEELALLRNIHRTRITFHLGRGFAILDTNEKNETVCLHEQFNYFDGAKPPLWFVYSGMGSQWAGMGAQLMTIPVFAAAIERCRRVLEPKGVDIVHIITSPDKSIFDNILNSFVGIAAIQIGLTDILRELDIFPDMIIGHSVGELGCAYADGCFTAEEMILSAYSRGLVSVQTPFIRGSMAAVGVGHQQISKMCPPEIEVACHNGPDSSTISGPADLMKQFVAQLTAKGIFAKEVPCSNIAYHSRYIAEAGPGLLKYLSEVITSPKARSKRWISTSVPEEKWNDPIAKYSSAEYHTNNLLNSVLFEEILKKIPSNAVLVEIAPHGLLQAILKRSLPESCKHIPLTRRGHPNNTKFLLEAIGNLYMEGYNPQVQALYPKIEFPVSTGTPMLSHLVEWAHNEKWNVLLYANANRKSSAQCKHVVSVLDDDHCYLKGHVIREKNVYPFAATLVAVWDTLAMVLGLPKKQFSVQFRDVHLHSQPVLNERRLLRLNVSIHRGKGRFEVLHDNVKVATGFVVGEIDTEITNVKEEDKSENVMEFKSNDVYQLLYARDYTYSNQFRSIYNADISFTKANLIWQDNWVTLIDGMIQLNTLRRLHESVSQLSFIRTIKIDVDDHLSNKTSIENTFVLPAYVSDLTDSTRCGGVLMEQMQFHDLPILNKEKITFKTLQFVPHCSTNQINETSAIYVFLQILAENLNKRIINIVEVIEYKGQNRYKNIQQIIHDIPKIQVNFSQICRDDLTKMPDDFLEGCDVLLITNLAADDNICQLLHKLLRRDAYLINREECAELTIIRPSLLYRNMCAHTIGSLRLELNVWQPSDVTAGTSAVTVFSQADLTKLYAQLSTLPPRHNLIILTSKPLLTGIKDLIKERRNKDNRKINVLINSHEMFDEQCLNKVQFTDFAINILEKGTWGGEYYLPIQQKSITGREMALEMKRLGDIESLHWTEVSDTKHEGISVKVQYMGLNDAYVKKVLKVAVSGNNTDNNRIEYDFSGTTEKKVRVMGIAQEQSISTSVKAKPELVWPVPDHWTLEDAATVPLAYCMAFYCLCFRSRLYRGNSILVHGGAGALGQAVISIALAHGCDIYTTVSNTKKKQFLLKLFPELKADQIGNSRDCTFKDMVLRGTKGNGCNIVISCVSGEQRTASLYCCSPFGFIVDTSVLLDKDDYIFEMYSLDKCGSYCTQQFSTLFEPQNVKDLKRLQLMVSDGIARGYVRPLSRVVYAAGEVSRALRLQAGSKHTGRVLLHFQKDNGPQAHNNFRIECSTDRWQVLLLDNEILGVQLVERLINRGARKFSLHFSNKSSTVLSKLRSWQKQGIQCIVSYGSTWNGNIFKNVSMEDVEGIYCVLHSNTQSDNVLKYLEKLTVSIQKLNRSLKYFSVIDARNNVNELIKLAKPHESFTSIKLPPLKVQLNENYINNKEFISINEAVDAIEKALCYKQRVVEVCRVNESKGILKEVADIAGLTVPDDVPPEATLKDLGLDLTKSQIVRTCLYDDYNILLDESTIPLLTIKDIRELEDGMLQKRSIETDDLKTFFSYIEQDAIQATADIILLPTLTTSADLRGDEYDAGHAFLCIIPGVEGLHVRFRELSERLKLPAVVLQPGLDRPHETIQEMAQRYTEILLKKTQMKKRFYLLGYESGVLVALEMAGILEDHGLTGTVFCIGGAPGEVQAKFEETFAEFETEESMQIAVARHMFTLLIDDDDLKDLEHELKNKSTWKEKVSLCVQKLQGRFNHSIQYSQEFIEAAYGRIVQTRRYNSEPRSLHSLLISIRPWSPSSSPITSHSLQNHSQQQVIEYELEAPLAYAARDLQCAAIVNRHLDRELLEEFDKRNLCETYITDADSFMTVVNE